MHVRGTLVSMGEFVKLMVIADINANAWEVIQEQTVNTNPMILAVSLQNKIVCDIVFQ